MSFLVYLWGNQGCAVGVFSCGVACRWHWLSHRRLFRGSPMFSACSCTSHDFRHPFPPVSPLTIGFRNIFHIWFPQSLWSIRITSAPPDYTFRYCVSKPYGSRDFRSAAEMRKSCGKISENRRDVASTYVLRQSSVPNFGWGGKGLRIMKEWGSADRGSDSCLIRLQTGE